MKLYACGIMATKREAAAGGWKVTTSLAVFHVEATSEDEATGKAYRIALREYPRDVWDGVYNVMASDLVCEPADA